MKIKISLIVIFLFANIIVWQIAYDQKPGELMVDFLNVGQGDSTFIQTPNHNQILIDGGPSSAVLEKVSLQMPFYDKTIELMILSHPEKDHLAGLIQVLRKYKVKNILWTGVVRDTKEWQEWEKLIEKEGAKIKIALAGEKIVLGKDIYFQILNPLSLLSNKEFKDSNDTSVVAKLVYGSKSFLFTGDISSKEEKLLLNQDIKADVLKIAHHGSKYSSSDSFLQEVSPRIAVISVGENSYGHPEEGLLAKLENFGIQIKRTDLNGDIKIFSNGNNLRVINN